MEAIPFSLFPEPKLNFFNPNGEIKFRYELAKTESSHVEQYVYCYFITPSSKFGKTWSVRGSSVGYFPTVYKKRITIHSIDWKFSRTLPGEINLLLVYVLGNGQFTRSEIVCDFKAKREEISSDLKPLFSAAKRFGIPGNGAHIEYVYNEEDSTQKDSNVRNPMISQDDKYFKMLGLVPTSNIGLVKAAYRELAKQYHPDTNKGISQERMKEINEAYEHIISKIQNMDKRH